MGILSEEKYFPQADSLWQEIQTAGQTVPAGRLERLAARNRPAAYGVCAAAGMLAVAAAARPAAQGVHDVLEAARFFIER